MWTVDYGPVSYTRPLLAPLDRNKKESCNNPANILVGSVMRRDIRFNVSSVEKVQWRNQNKVDGLTSTERGLFSLQIINSRRFTCEKNLSISSKFFVTMK